MEQRRLALTAITAFFLSALIVVLDTRLVSAVTFDFSSGPGPDFELFNIQNVWTIGTAGPDLPITKPQDPNTEDPTAFVAAGIRSNFCVTGDFTVTVKFDLVDFAPDPTHAATLNEAVLGVSAGSASFLVLRYDRGDGRHGIEAFGSPGPIGDDVSSLANGRFRIQRVGNVVTGSYSPTGSEIFTVLGSLSDNAFSEPMLITVYGAQGHNTCECVRASSSLDIHFDDLVVDGVVAGCGATPVILRSWGRIKTLYR